MRGNEERERERGKGGGEVNRGDRFMGFLN